MDIKHKPSFLKPGTWTLGSLAGRTILIHCALVLITAITLSTAIHFLQQEARITRLGANLEHIAATGALLIDGEDHTKIKTRADAQSDAFMELQFQLEKIRAANDLSPDAIYTLRPVEDKDGKIIMEFVTMLGTPYTGDRYTLRPEMAEALDKQCSTHTSEVYADRYGMWLSAYAPIFGPDGKLDGLLEVDYRADKLGELDKNTRNNTIFYTLLCILVAMFSAFLTLRWFFRPVQALALGINALEEGNYEHRIQPIETTSELKRITDTFNSMVSNIAEREQTLQASERRYRTLFSAVQEAIFLVHRDSQKIIDVNGAGEEMLALDKTEILGGPFLEIFSSNVPGVPAEDNPNCLVWLLQQNEVMEDHVCRLVRRGPNNEALFYEAQVAEVEVDNQNAWLITCRDVTRHRQEWSALLQTSKLAALGEMAGGLAHQINNPLVGVLNFAQLLRRRLPEGDPNTELAATIESAAERCRDVVRALLRFGRQDAAVCCDVDARNLIEEAVLLSEGQLHKRSGTVHVDIAEDLIPIVGNRTQIIQVVLNLINNAFQASPENPRVEIRAGMLDTMVHIDISDNGSGVPENIQDRIFEPFFSTKAEGEGTGLGLSVAYGIIQQHGGELTLLPQSPQNPGATFRITLPTACGPNSTALDPMTEHHP